MPQQVMQLGSLNEPLSRLYLRVGSAMHMCTLGLPGDISGSLLICLNQSDWILEVSKWTTASFDLPPEGSA